jgi:uncharacterized protein with NRDE domain
VCTLVVVSRVWAELPLLVAANRDERKGRPVWPPAEYSVSGTRIFGPRDAEAGGTWLGLNEYGLFVGITNRFGRAPVAGRRSRGLLVTDALSERRLEDAVRRSAEHPASVHNGFHLVLAGREQASLVYSDGDSVTVRALDPGVHAFTERSLGAADAARESFVRKAFGGLTQESHPPSNERIAEILSVPSPPEAPFDGTVIDVPEFDYGTRSSTILRFEASRVGFWYADGPPTQAAYVPHDVFSKSY